MPDSLELIELSSDEGETELYKDMEKPDEEVGEHEPLEGELEGHNSDPEDEDLEMEDVDSDFRVEDDDSSHPGYDPSRDR